MDNVPVESVIYHIVINVLFSTLTSWFLKQSTLTTNLRKRIQETSNILNKLIECPHCLCFWASFVGATILSSGMIEFGIVLLIGWRGGFYGNRLINLMDKRSVPKTEKKCIICNKSYKKSFLVRQGNYYCSYDCWFGHLKDIRRNERPIFDENKTFTRQEVYPVSINNVDPKGAKQLLDADDGYYYIDVRSIPEYETGHPEGAYNIPILHRQGGGMIPNMDFLRVIEKHFDHDSKLLLGCQMGVRSMRAAEALAAAGYTNLTNVDGGFGGTRDSEGTVVNAGWEELGLPIETDNSNSRDFTSLSEG